MLRFISARRARVASAALMLVVSGSLLPVAGTVAAPRHAHAVVNPASGGTTISADEAGTNRYTRLVGPAMQETSVGELALHSTTILNIPEGFRFNPNVGSWSVDGIECDLSGTLTMSATQATFKVTHPSTVPSCTLWFVGLQVQPTSGVGIAGGNIFIRKTGASAAPGGNMNYGTLAKVAGAVDELSYWTQPGGSAHGGVQFPDQPEVGALDQFGNEVRNALVKLSITPGSGPSGAHLTCATNPVRADGNGVADFTGCKIDRAGSYKLRATSAQIVRDSGKFTVAVGSAAKLIFTAYPRATTTTTFTPQPRVAVTDAGGNVVTDYPTTHITLAINTHAGTFTCAGGYPVVQAINGVAQFHGCKQTTVGGGYQLLAWAGFASVTGPAFKVTR